MTTQLRSTVSPELLALRDQLFEAWRAEVATLEDDAARDFVFAVKMRMTELAFLTPKGGMDPATTWTWRCVARS